MNVAEMKFQRVFSKSMNKNLKLPLGEMTFSKDFVRDNRGDLYPIIAKDDACIECVDANQYGIQNGTVERMVTRFFPYATYEMEVAKNEGNCGFVFHLADQAAKIIWDGKEVLFSDGSCGQKTECSSGTSCDTVIVSCRPGAFDIYLRNNEKPEYLCTFKSEIFSHSNEQKQFREGFVSVLASGNVTIKNVCSYMDCGISQADIRAICYENGEPIFENGKVYLTASIRMQEGGFQGVFSWIPSTSEIELTGALFFDCGDGFWRNYLASSLLFHRKTKEWYLWTSSFEHKHILCHASFAGEPRFGVNVIDVTMMEPANTNDPTVFAGFPGDEDPDFYYNEQEGKWYLAICRVSPVTGNYRYLFFRSKDPFRDYTYIGQGVDGAETGGSFVTIENEMVFVCGNSFEKRANYRMYTKDGMQEAQFDFDDGGFRGWGTVIPVTMGSRKRYFWLTFDRHNGSSYNWSYGNIYCFEAEL